MMEDLLRDALQSKTKAQIIEYAMQVRFERDFLQSQLNKMTEIASRVPDAKILEVRNKLWADEMGLIIENFICYVNQTKGYKIGVGQHLIERYLDSVYGKK